MLLFLRDPNGYMRWMSQMGSHRQHEGEVELDWDRAGHKIEQQRMLLRAVRDLLC